MRIPQGIVCLAIAAMTLALTPRAMAQAGTGFTITDGDVVFTQVNSPTTGTAAGVSGANFRVNGAAGTDHLFENWWWFRVDGVDTRELNFFNASGTSAGGNTATTNWQFALFSASLNYTVVDQGTNLGTLTERLTVVNTSAGTILLNLFNYTDFDVNATSGLDSATLFGPGHMKVTDSASAWDVRFTGGGASAFQVTPFATLRGLLTNTSVNNLNNTGLPFGPGDFTGGFQWTLSLAPGEQAIISERLAVVPEPGTMIALGLGAAALLKRRRSKKA